MAISAPPLDVLNTPTVQLLHERRNDSHIDWMLSPDDSGATPLITFRSARRIDEVGPDEQVDLERIDDHRAAYLDFEGVLSGDRGAVRRLMRGRIRSWRRDPGDVWRLRIEWGDNARHRLQTLELRPRCAAPWWRATCIDEPNGTPSMADRT